MKTENRELPIGAEPHRDGGFHFRLWAPRAKRVRIVFEGDRIAPVQMTAEDRGYFAAHVPGTETGMLYRFGVDDGEMLYPDPASRYQPAGPHGPSELVEADRFTWTDARWTGLTVAGQVFYEMHVGTYTQAGTLSGARRHLQYLKDLGITCIELMPICEFPGRFGWGYDGVDLFAPYHGYGSCDDLRRFVDSAHAVGLGVILDVVYNHFGPDGNYLMQFGPYLSDKHRNDWGQSVNFDGEGCEGVREFFLTNTRYWVREYHADGFRFDATQAIIDDSPVHILAEVAAAARKEAEAPGRSVLLVCENEPQDTRLVRPKEQGGYGMDALWNDDFHHSAMVALSGRNEAYYADYLGRPQEFVSAAKWGYLYQGQFYRWQQQRRGTPGLDLVPTAFVHFIQNHDQIANYGHGFRAHLLSSLAQYKAMTTLLLLGPQTPMLFQGQEYAAAQPFYYFADHQPDLAALVRKGRVKELSQFPSVAQPEVQAVLPDPGAEETFRRCKLEIGDSAQRMHAWIYKLHQDLLRLRREEQVFRRVQRRGAIDGAVLGHGAFLLRYFSPSGDDRLLIVNLETDLHLTVAPEPLLGAPAEKEWEVMWSSEHPDYGGSGNPPMETRNEDWRLPGENWTIPGRCAAVLRPVPCRECKFPGPKRVGLEEHEQK